MARTDWSWVDDLEREARTMRAHGQRSAVGRAAFYHCARYCLRRAREERLRGGDPHLVRGWLAWARVHRQNMRYHQEVS